MRAPVLAPKPFPPRNRPFGSVPLPLEGSGVGPVLPPPATALGGEPKLTRLGKLGRSMLRPYKKSAAITRLWDG